MKSRPSKVYFGGALVKSTLKKAVAVWVLVAAMILSSISVFAANVPASGNTTIVPNKLTITWSDASKASVTIDTFRFYGYNVAQLRTMVSALGGSVNSLSDKTYQLVASGTEASFTPIGFTSAQEVNYIMNTTPIRNTSGTLVYPNEPGWVYLTKYSYNWASIRDVAAALNIQIVSVNDDSIGGKTSVVVKAAGGTTSSDTAKEPIVLNPGSGSSGYVSLPTAAPEPSVSYTAEVGTLETVKQGDIAFTFIKVKIVDKDGKYVTPKSFVVNDEYEVTMQNDFDVQDGCFGLVVEGTITNKADITVKSVKF